MKKGVRWNVADLWRWRNEKTVLNLLRFFFVFDCKFVFFLFNAIMLGYFEVSLRGMGFCCNLNPILIELTEGQWILALFEETHLKTSRWLINRLIFLHIIEMKQVKLSTQGNEMGLSFWPDNLSNRDWWLQYTHNSSRSLVINQVYSSRIVLDRLHTTRKLTWQEKSKNVVSNFSTFLLKTEKHFIVTVM